MGAVITDHDVYVEAPTSYYPHMKSALVEPEIVTKNGKPVSVIIPIKAYREMLERLEDAEDVEYLKKARRKLLNYRPLADVLADFRKQ